MLRLMIAKVGVLLGLVGTEEPTNQGESPTEPTIAPISMTAVPDVPTIEPLQPTAYCQSIVVGGRVGAGSAPDSADHTPRDRCVTRMARRPLTPENAAPAFISWLRHHGLDLQQWAVDEVWFLAAEDFAPANNVVLPPRNRFLGAMQRLAGVQVQYDKRIWRGGQRVKTTVYSFEVDIGREAVPQSACEQKKRAA